MSQSSLIASLEPHMAASEDKTPKKLAKKMIKKLIKAAYLLIDDNNNISLPSTSSSSSSPPAKRTKLSTPSSPSSSSLPDVKYILAPMVGASELPFRLLCRSHGATIAYTPMISSARFAVDAEYRKESFETTPADRPLVAHFSANDPAEFAASAAIVAPQCDAIDLNLGCPQRVAYIGHYGSYLLDPVDRPLVLSLVRAAVAAVTIPVFVKIRLLNTLPETIALVGELKDAGASLVAIHGRYRASFERTGAGARDGAAMLDQIATVKARFPDFPIITNGNIITHDDVSEALKRASLRQYTI